MSSNACMLYYFCENFSRRLYTGKGYSFNIHVGMLSGPADFPGFNSCNNFTIPCVVKSILAILGYLGKLGKSFRVSHYNMVYPIYSMMTQIHNPQYD